MTENYSESPTVALVHGGVPAWKTLPSWAVVATEMTRPPGSTSHCPWPSGPVRRSWRSTAPTSS